MTRVELSKSDPRVQDLFRPDLTPQLSQEVKQSVLNAVGIELSDQNVSEIFHSDRFLGRRPDPATPESRNALMNFDKAASRLLIALRAIQSEASKGVLKDLEGRTNLAADFMGSGVAESREEAKRIGYFWEPAEYVDDVSHDVILLQKKARRTLSWAVKAERGRGREATGYDNFVLACHRVWMQHRSDKGYSMKAGRGAGPFVRFVYLAQELLPRAKRKPSEAAAGDAVVKVLKGTKKK